MTIIFVNIITVHGEHNISTTKANIQVLHQISWKSLLEKA